MDNPDLRGRPRVQTINDDPTITVQSDAEYADINKILSKFDATGVAEHLNVAKGRFLDIGEFTDYADAMRQIRAAEEYFHSLHPKLRKHFNHDIGSFLDAAHDPEKRQLLIDAGLMEGVPTPPPEPAPASPEPTPAPAPEPTP